MGVGRNKLGAEVKREIRKCLLRNKGMCFEHQGKVIELRYKHMQEQSFAMYVDGDFKQFVGSYSATVAAIEG